MSRLATSILLGAAALLNACATPGEPPAPSGATPPAAAPAPRRAASQPNRAPQFDWRVERERISKRLAGSPDITVAVREDGALQLLLPGTDAFQRGGAEPLPGLQAALDRIAAVVAPADEIGIQVFGHTDSIASELHNLQLSIARAETVAEHLRSRGIAFARLQADGKGESEPIADNGTEAGRAKNRRVEIVLRPLE